VKSMWIHVSAVEERVAKMGEVGLVVLIRTTEKTDSQSLKSSLAFNRVDTCLSTDTMSFSLLMLRCWMKLVLPSPMWQLSMEWPHRMVVLVLQWKMTLNKPNNKLWLSGCFDDSQ
jgi:hypothetical protein